MVRRWHKLTAYEKSIEAAIGRGEYVRVSPEEEAQIRAAIEKKRAEIRAQRRKDAVLNIRVNSQDLARIKKKAKKAGLRYQTFITEFLHQLAES